MRIRALIVLALIVPGSFAGGQSPDLFREDFESFDEKDWVFTDKNAWRIADSEDSKGLELFQKSRYTPKVRSPLNIAILESPLVDSFTLDVRVRSTVPNYDHRDLCLIFGYQDPEHFYYVHLGKQADPHSHSIFLVNNAPRVSIADERTKGTPWADGWHAVRVTREKSGSIRVFFDDMEKPIMKAHDTTFGEGKIGLGSFDDRGMFDDLVIRRADAKP